MKNVVYEQLKKDPVVVWRLAEEDGMMVLECGVDEPDGWAVLAIKNGRVELCDAIPKDNDCGLHVDKNGCIEVTTE